MQEIKLLWIIMILQLLCISCKEAKRSENIIEQDAGFAVIKKTGTKQELGDTIDTKEIRPGSLVNFAKTLIGAPYKYAGTDPSGFDCSGFITYVFNNFDIVVPRSSVDFTNAGNEILLKEAREGDLVLFTGTDSTIRVVGHMGIVVENTNTLKFIHSSSGKAYGVTITPLNKYYEGRFIKVTRVFNSL